MEAEQEILTNEMTASSTMHYMPVAMDSLDHLSGLMAGEGVVAHTPAIHTPELQSVSQPICPWYPPLAAVVPVPTVCFVVMPGTDACTGRANQSVQQCKSAPWCRQHTRRKQDAEVPFAPGTWQRADGKKKRGKNTVNADPEIDSKWTTVILKNCPAECTRDMVLEVLDQEGFFGGYDFVHVPLDFQTKQSLGYAIVNMVSHRVALRALERLNGFNKWPSPCEEVCEVTWNSPHQGLTAHVDRYRNSPLMHERVPKTYRPALFKNGLQIDFPAPTSHIRPPRIRHPKLAIAKV
jgi:hypothetical protein